MAKKTVKRAANSAPKKAAVKKTGAKRPAAGKTASKALPVKPRTKPPAKARRAPAQEPKRDAAREQLTRLVNALLDKKAQAVTSVAVGPLVGFTDYYLIATGTSSKHNQTLCDAIVESETRLGRSKPRREGYEAGTWIVVDTGDVVAHIFDDASRHYYDLEKLFMGAERKLYGENGKIIDLPRTGKGA